MKNDNSSCSGDSDPLPHCKPDSCRPQVDLTQIIKSVFFCPRRTVQHTKSPLFNLVKEPSCPTTGWKQTKHHHHNHHHQCNDTKDHQFPTCSARLQS